jgi:hypothetical protein
MKSVVLLAFAALAFVTIAAEAMAQTRSCWTSCSGPPHSRVCTRSCS